jgi:hypothetical protein
MKEFKNIHYGESCFILGTAPSINKMDLKPLKKIVTIGCNRIGKKYKPDYLCISDTKNCYLKYTKEIDKIKAVKVMCSPIAGQEINLPDDIYKVELISNKSLMLKDDYKFDSSFKKVAWTTNVITDLCFPFAYFLGFKNVYLIGCDCTDAGHFYPNDGDCVKIGSWQERFVYYKKIKQLFESDGRKIYNAGIGGKLNVFKRIKFKEAIKLCV